MDFSSFDTTYLILVAVMVLLLVLQGWLIKRPQAWLGIFVPTVYIGLLVYLAATVRVLTLTDFVFAALGLFGLVAWWASAREARRQQSETDQRFGNTPMTATDFRVSFPPSGHGSPSRSRMWVG